MWTAILGVIQGAIRPITDLIDNLHTSDEEKLEAKQKIMAIQAAVTSQVLEVQKAQVEASKDIIVAEAKGEGWLQRSWRPVTMLVFVVIIANNYILNPWLSAMFGIDILMDIPPDMWALLKIGLGGYVVSRGVEKSVKNLKG